MIEALVVRKGRVGTVDGRLEDDHPQGSMHLRRGKACAVGVDHGLDHVGHQPADFGCRGVWDGRRAFCKDRMTHAGNLENGHAVYMRPCPGRVKAAQRTLGCARRIDSLKTIWYHPAPLGNARKPEPPLQIIVRDNNIDQALKALKKKMQREGIFREMKLRGHYEKPSEKRARERAEAIRRYRKLQRKRLQREGVAPR